jgi:hypothetical protein
MISRRKNSVEKFAEIEKRTDELSKEVAIAETKRLASFETYKKELITLQQNITKQFLMLGSSLQKAMTDFSKDRFNELLRETGITKRTSERLIKIFNDERIASLGKRIPNAWTTAHYLSSLDNSEFEMVKGSITPTATLTFYKNIVEGDEGYVTEKHNKLKSSAFNFANIKLKHVVSNDIQNLINKNIQTAIKKIKDQLDVDVSLEIDNSYIKQIARKMKEHEKFEKLLENSKFIQPADLTQFLNNEKVIENVSDTVAAHESA